MTAAGDPYGRRADAAGGPRAGGAGEPLAGAPRGPLAGLSVLVTRPRLQAGPLTAALAAAGAHTVEIAVIEVAEPEDRGAALERALAELERYDWVVFTSANAVHRTMARLPGAVPLGGVLVAAVGAATARALAGHRVAADLVPARQDAAGLVAELPDAGAPRHVISGAATPRARLSGGGGPGARVLFPAAAGVGSTLARGIAAKGWAVDQVAAYRTVPAPPPAPEVLPALAAADVVTFASPSAVESYLTMRVGDCPLPLPPAVACVGPVTAAAARAAGLTVTVEAEQPSPAALVDALARWVRSPQAP